MRYTGSGDRTSPLFFVQLENFYNISNNTDQTILVGEHEILTFELRY